MNKDNYQVLVTIPRNYPDTNCKPINYRRKISRPSSYIPKAPPFKVTSIETLLKFSKSFQRDRFILDHYKLRKIKKPLEKLNNIIGHTELKEEIFNLIIYLLLYHEKGDLLHTVLQGPPGTGKTTIAEILAELYSGLGYLKKGHIIKAKRNDFIGPFLGQTTERTTNILKEAQGGVLFIDEAYQLGNPGEKDSYSKECLDAINQALTENKDNFICIIAGYKDSLENSFFSKNDGLNRRFPYKFTLNKYNNKELSQIFSLKCKENKWTHDSFNFPENIEFKENGGDMEKMFHYAKINHTRRVINSNNFKRKHLTVLDIENTFKHFKNKNNNNKNDYMYL